MKLFWIVFSVGIFIINIIIPWVSEPSAFGQSLGWSSTLLFYTAVKVYERIIDDYINNSEEDSCDHDWVIGKVDPRYKTCRKCHTHTQIFEGGCI